MTAPQLFTVRFERRFVDALAAGVLERFGRDPVVLSDIVILLPTKRAAASVREAFLQALGTDVSLLPRLHGFGEFDDEDRLGPALGPAFWRAAEDLPPAMPAPRRRFLLMRQVVAWGQARGEPVAPAQAWRLADELGALIDEATAFDVKIDDLHDLVPENFARHWQVTRDFLTIVSRTWPDILSAHGMIDARDRSDRLLRAYADILENRPPDHPVIAAGSTGTRPATRRLLQAVARLPRGAVILPGFDRAMDDASWGALGISGAASSAHPQAAMRNLLADIGADRHEVLDWETGNSAPADSPRTRFLKDALRPAATTLEWADMPWRGAARPQFDGLEIVRAAGLREEAAAVALALRETLEVPGKTAMLVTPDRALADHVRRQLAFWQIDIDDSGGTPARTSSAGRFLLLVAEVAADRFAPVSLLALLQHPMTRAGRARAEHLAVVRRLDKVALRGPRPAAGYEGLMARVESSGLDEADQAWLEAALAPLLALSALLETSVDVGACLRAHLVAAESLARGPENEEEAPNPAAPQETVASSEIQAPDASDLSNQPGTADGAARLWAGDAGRALADALSTLLAEGDSAGRIEGRDYRALFTEWVDGVNVRPAWQRHPRLRILSPQEARLQAADLVILGSLNEGSWPKNPEPDPWMNREMRAGLGLPDPMIPLGQSAHDFITLAASPRVLLTRAEKSEGSPTVPSRWLYRMEALAAAPIPEADRYSSWTRALADAPEVTPTAPPAPRPPLHARPRKLSVTQVELWMRDPYSLYARKILDLKKLDPVDDTPTAAQKGTLLHDALEQFLAKPGPKRGEDGLARLIACGRDAFRPIETQPTVYAFWWPRFLRIAAWFVQHEALRDETYQTVLVEAWGRLRLTDADFELIAKADRIDRIFGSNMLEIIDYKTGTPPTPKQVAAGFAPQLPLEALIAERGGFEGLEAREVSSLVYWHIRGGDPVEEKHSPVKDVAAAIADAERGLITLVRAFDHADIPYLANPRPAVSGYGDYDHLARVGEWREAEDGLGGARVVPLKAPQKGDV